MKPIYKLINESTNVNQNFKDDIKILVIDDKNDFSV